MGHHRSLLDLGSSAIAAIVLLVGLFIPGCSGQDGSEERPRQSVLFITMDDYRPMMRVYGRKFMHTPALDSLSAEGLQLNRAYMQQGGCAPSRTSFLTGLRADTTRVYDLVTLFRETLADLVGLSVPDGPQGVSLRELFEDPDASVKSAAYSQFIRNADRTYTTYEEAVAMGQAVRTDRYRFILLDRAAGGRWRHDPRALRPQEGSERNGQSTGAIRVCRRCEPSRAVGRRPFQDSFSMRYVTSQFI